MPSIEFGLGFIDAAPILLWFIKPRQEDCYSSSSSRFSFMSAWLAFFVWLLFLSNWGLKFFEWPTVDSDKLGRPSSGGWYSEGINRGSRRLPRLEELSPPAEFISTFALIELWLFMFRLWRGSRPVPYTDVSAVENTISPSVSVYLQAFYWRALPPTA